MIGILVALLLTQTPPSPAPAAPEAPAVAEPQKTPAPPKSPAPAPAPKPGTAAKPSAPAKAPAPAAVPAPPLPPEPEPPTLVGFDKPSGKTFTGEFINEPIEPALKAVAKEAGMSIVLPPGLRGGVSASFQGAAVEDVLLVLLEQNGLRAEKKGSIVMVERAGEARVIVRGGKRRVAFGNRPNIDIQIDTEAIRREAEEARREAEREMRKAQREMERAQREMGTPPAMPDGDAGPELPEDPDEVGDHDQSSGQRVLSGDQVIRSGEHLTELVVLRGNIVMEPGASAEQVTAVLGSVDIGPGVEIEREVVAVGGDIHVGPGARVGGDAVSVGGQLVLDQGAVVEGEQVSINVPGIAGILSLVARERPWEAPESRIFSAGKILAQFAILLALGLLMLVMIPRRVESVGAMLSNAPGKSLLAGFVGSLAVPVLAVLLAVTVVGIPLIAVEILALLVAGLLGFTALAHVVGARLPLGERAGSVVRLAVATALLVLLTQIPVLGCLVWITGWLVVFGAVVRTRFGQPPTALPAVPPPMPPPAPPPVVQQ